MRAVLWMSMVAFVTALPAFAEIGRGGQEVEAATRLTRVVQADAPASRQMGGQRSVTTFFVTSMGMGKGGDLGGLAGADAHCQALAAAEGAGDHTWRAYLSASATASSQAINARDRIGAGPWYNSEGRLVARTVDDLHGPASKLGRSTALTERLDEIGGVGDEVDAHAILTGSRPDGTAFPADIEDRTCHNWTSSGDGQAAFGYSDRPGVTSWNSAGRTRSCSQADLESEGSFGLLYCFAAD